MTVLAAWVMAAAAAQAPFTTVAKGEVSGQQNARQVIIRTAAEWGELWKEHEPIAKLPVVDFAQRMIVGVFLGTKPSAGYDVEIVGVRTADNELVVEYVQRQPGRGTMAAQVLVEPYHLVSVPRHAGTVRFSQLPDTQR